MVYLFEQQRHACISGILLLFCFFYFQNLKAQQNLVPNSSFEQYTNCPSGANLYALKNSKPDFWYKPDKRTGGYANACADSLAGVPIHYTAGGKDFQYARTGVGYIGMFYRNGISANQRNYFQVQLTDSLQPGKCYYAECYINFPGTFEMACNNQSVLLTNNAVYADTTTPLTEFISANPQITNYSNNVITDTLNWVKVSGVFVAQGGEQYLTVGNFRDNNHTKYIRVLPPGTGYEGAAYYVDDVSLYAVDSMPLKADAGPDTTIALGDSVFIGSLTNGITNITWYNSSGAVINTVAPGFYASLAANTFYVVEQTVCGYTSRDTVNVTVNLLPLKWLGFAASALQDLTPAPLPGERGEKPHWSAGRLLTSLM